jgi:hypothetical protein
MWRSSPTVQTELSLIIVGATPPVGVTRRVQDWNQNKFSFTTFVLHFKQAPLQVLNPPARRTGPSQPTAQEGC